MNTIDTTKGLTVVIGSKIDNVLDKAFDAHANAGWKYTYMLERYNTNIVDYMYYALRNDLNRIAEDVNLIKANNVPVVIFIKPFDRMQSIKMINDIKDLLHGFLNDVKRPVHIYIGAHTYEMCRNEECLVSHTGDVVRYDSYEAWRTTVM